MLRTIPDWIKSETLPVYPCKGNTGIFKPGIKTKTVKVYKVSLGAAEYLQNLQSLAKTEPAFFNQVTNHGGEWAGLHGETAHDVLTTGKSTTAQSDLQKANGKLQTPLVGGNISLSNRGPSFAMARVLQGHPVSCLKREKTKLPPIKLNIGLFFNAAISAADATASLAKVIRAALEYKMAGGIVHIRLNMYTDLSYPHNDHSGVIVYLDLPLNSLATAATIGGIQGYRALFLSFAASLSAASSDSLPSTYFPAIPGGLTLTGVPENDRAILEALKVK